MERTAFVWVSEFGSISDQRRDDADDDAEEELEIMLEEDFDCVPCPCCGDYQPEMARQLKEERYRGMIAYQPLVLFFGIFGCLVGLLCTIITAANADRRAETNILVVAGVSIIGWMVGLGLLALWAWLRWTHASRTAAYDPNDPEDREQRLADAHWITSVIDAAEPRRGRQ
jgi:hypothetical protein